MLCHCYYTSLIFNRLQCGIPMTNRQSWIRGFTCMNTKLPKWNVRNSHGKVESCDLFIFTVWCVIIQFFVYCLRTLTIIRCMSAFCISWILALKVDLHIIHSFWIAKLLILNIGRFEILWIYGLLAVACTQMPNFIVVIFSCMT